MNMPLPSFMNLADLVAVGYVLLCMIVGYFRGLSGEIARLVSVVAAFVVGIVTYDPVAVWLDDHSRLEAQHARALAFIVIVLTSILVLFLLRFVCRRVMRLVIEETLDKKAGILAGLLHSALFVFIVFVAMNMWPDERVNRLFGGESAIGRATLSMMPVLRQELGEKLEPTTN